MNINSSVMSIKLENLFQEKKIFPQVLVTKILEDLDFWDLIKLSTVNKAWNRQVSEFPVFKHLCCLSDLPRWVGFKSTSECKYKTPSLDNFQVEKDEHTSMDDVLEQLGIDINNEDELEECYGNRQLIARAKKIYNELNYRICLSVAGTIRGNNTFQLERICHEIEESKLCYLANLKGQTISIVPISEKLHSIIFKLTFDNVSAYNPEIGQEKNGRMLMLRLKKIDIHSIDIHSTEFAKNQLKYLKKAVKMLSQICQQFNRVEDNQFLRDYN